jgi:hypothetical protein
VSYVLVNCSWYESSLKGIQRARHHQRVIPVIPATQEVEVKRITVQSQPRQIVHETLSQKILHKNRAGGVAQGEGPEFKPQYHNK